MTLKATVKNLDNVDEKYHDLYTKGEDGYYLDLEGVDTHPAAGALKRAKDRTATERDNLKESLRESQEKVAGLEKQIKDGGSEDVKALEKSWQTKYDTDIQAKQQELENRDKTLNQLLVDNEADRLAKEWSTMPALMKNEIRQRLAPEIDENGARTRVLDANGKPSAMSLNDLREEYRQNSDYAGAMKSDNKASGTGGSQNRGGSNTGGSASGEGPGGEEERKPVNLNELTPQQMVEHRRAKRKEAEQQTEE